MQSYKKSRKKIFFHPDFTVGFGITPNHALRLVGFTTGREFHPALKFVFNLCVYNNPFPPGCQVRFYHSPDRPPRCKSRISDNWLIFSRISLRVIPSLKVRSSKTSALLRPPSIKKQSVLLHFR